MMTKISYSGYRFPSEIIQRAIWLYVRFTLPGSDPRERRRARSSRSESPPDNGRKRHHQGRRVEILEGWSGRLCPCLTVISCFVSLTLGPVLCAVLFKAHHAHDLSGVGLARRLLHGAFDRFNRGFDRPSFGYGNLTRQLVRGVTIVLVVYAGVIGVAGVEFSRTPTGFFPEQDQGYLINGLCHGDSDLRPRWRFGSQ